MVSGATADMARIAEPVRLDPRILLGLMVVLGASPLLLPVRSPGNRATRTILRIDPNTAPREVLAALPNLGPARVKTIEEGRAKAPFRSAADLSRRVKGIGPATIAELQPFLRFDPPPLIHP
ncbi:MAG: ral secretion pathway protein [Planctomycetota bacterium]|nr:ral secretion pathway protein [Planctomycetota bacterium]